MLPPGTSTSVVQATARYNHFGPFSGAAAVIALAVPTTAGVPDTPPGPINGQHGEEDAMKELIKQYLDNGISRRQAHNRPDHPRHEHGGGPGDGAIARDLRAGRGALRPASAMREMQGTGGALFVPQLKAAGIEYIFFNPSTGD